MSYLKDVIGVTIIYRTTSPSTISTFQKIKDDKWDSSNGTILTCKEIEEKIELAFEDEAIVSFHKSIPPNKVLKLLRKILPI